MFFVGSAVSRGDPNGRIDASAVLSDTPVGVESDKSCQDILRNGIPILSQNICMYTIISLYLGASTVACSGYCLS